MREVTTAFTQPDLLQGSLRPARRVRSLRCVGAELHVLDRCEARQPVERLEDETHGVPSKHRLIGPRRATDVHATHLYRT